MEALQGKKFNAELHEHYDKLAKQYMDALMHPAFDKISGDNFSVWDALYKKANIPTDNSFWPVETEIKAGDLFGRTINEFSSINVSYRKRRSQARLDHMWNEEGTKCWLSEMQYIKLSPVITKDTTVQYSGETTKDECYFDVVKIPNKTILIGCEWDTKREKIVRIEELNFTPTPDTYVPRNIIEELRITTAYNPDYFQFDVRKIFELLRSAR